ncbi:MAG: hypothetical protein ACREOC_09555 [Gemmatimonadales bacterium]
MRTADFRWSGKPALDELHPDAEQLFSRAYAPFLSALLEEVALSSERIEALLEGMGRRLAAAAPPPTATFGVRL